MGIYLTSDANYGMYLAVTFHFCGYSVSIHIKKLKTATPAR